MARLLANEVAKTQGVTIVVENRPGVGSAIGTEAIARAPPDGNTLLLARTGDDQLPASFAFSGEEIELLDAINKDIQGKTQLQKNPHPTKTLAWAAWIVAKLGRWSGYASHKPLGPITIHHGLMRFQLFTGGWAPKNV